MRQWRSGDLKTSAFTIIGASSAANEPAFFQFPNLEMRQQLGIVEFVI